MTRIDDMTDEQLCYVIGQRLLRGKAIDSLVDAAAKRALVKQASLATAHEMWVVSCENEEDPNLDGYGFTSAKLALMFWMGMGRKSTDKLLYMIDANTMSEEVTEAIRQNGAHTIRAYDAAEAEA